MNKSNLRYKKISSISPELVKSVTSKAEPLIYNGYCAFKWQVESGLVNKLSIYVNKRRWEQGFPANIENA